MDRWLRRDSLHRGWRQGLALLHRSRITDRIRLEKLGKGKSEAFSVPVTEREDPDFNFNRAGIAQVARRLDAFDFCSTLATAASSAEMSTAETVMESSATR